MRYWGESIEKNEWIKYPSSSVWFVISLHWTLKTRVCMQPLSKRLRVRRGSRMGEEDKGWLNSDHMATWLREWSHQGLLPVTVALWNWDERRERRPGMKMFTVYMATLWDYHYWEGRQISAGKLSGGISTGWFCCFYINLMCWHALLISWFVCGFIFFFARWFWFSFHFVTQMLFSTRTM